VSQLSLDFSFFDFILFIIIVHGYNKKKKSTREIEGREEEGYKFKIEGK
jgi:transposase